jgi:hypothetical protein
LTLTINLNGRKIMKELNRDQLLKVTGGGDGPSEHLGDFHIDGMEITGEEVSLAAMGAVAAANPS